MTRKYHNHRPQTNLRHRKEETQNNSNHMPARKQSNRGSYRSAHVLLNLLNELGKRDKMRDLPSILSLFSNEFNKINNTRARLLNFIYHMAFRLL